MCPLCVWAVGRLVWLEKWGNRMTISNTHWFGVPEKSVFEKIMTEAFQELCQGAISQIQEVL